jgi:hypothetical protein
LFTIINKKTSKKHNKPLGSGDIKPLLCTRFERGTQPVKQRQAGVFGLTKGF